MAEFKVTEANVGQRLDRLMKTQCKDMPFVAVQKLIRTGKIRVDGKKAKPDVRLELGAVVTWPGLGIPVEAKGSAYQVTKADREMIAKATLFEDETLLILNKPAGLAAQAGSGQVRSLDRILVGMFGENAPKLTHRLDKETTGIIVLAKTRAAAAEVTRQFADREIEKVYLALLAGELGRETRGEIRAPLGKVGGQFGSRSVVRDHGDAAHTSWKLVARTRDGFNLVEATPHTGRMNQLRAHFAYIACPIVGDAKYGGRIAGSGPLFLHARRIGLTHPVSGARLRINAPLPPHFACLTFAGEGDILAQYS